MYRPVVTKYFGKYLSEQIKELELPLDYLVTYCQISLGSLKECLAGERLATPWQLILIAEALNCTVNDLLGFDKFHYKSNTLASSIPQAEYRIAERMWDDIYSRMNDMCLSPEYLADYAGVSITTFNVWFRGSRHSYPKTFVLIRICDALDCTPSDLLGY